MSKKTIVLVIILVLALIFTGCSSANDNGNASDTENEAATTEATDTPESTDTPEPTATPEPEIEYPTEFNSGDVLSFPNDFEITYLGTEFINELSPPNPEEIHTYYEVEDENNIYLDVMAYIKNLKGNLLMYKDAVTFKIVYDGEYNYDGFAVAEEADGSDFKSYFGAILRPLVTDKMHFLIEVPLEVRDSGKDFDIIMNVHGDEYRYSGQEGSGEVIQMAKAKELKTDESWQSLDTIAIDSTIVEEDYGEITLKSVEFNSRVDPANPTGYYTYYEVKGSEGIYIDAVVEFKNLKADSQEAYGLFDVKAIYDNAYNYSGFTVIESDDGETFDFLMSTDIDTLTSKTMHALIEVPLEITESGKPLAVVFEFNGKEYKYELS